MSTGLGFRTVEIDFNWKVSHKDEQNQTINALKIDIILIMLLVDCVHGWVGNAAAIKPNDG